MKNCVHSGVHTLKDTWDLGARGVRARGLCSRQLERLKPHKKISKIDLSWMKETLDFCF
jgi:hypothetical protein